MSDTQMNYIGGKWVPSASGETFPNTNPARPDEVLGAFQRSGPEDVDAAVEAAAEAQKEWRNTPAHLRGEIISRATRILIDRKPELAEGIIQEMGKVLVDSGYDVQGAITSGEHMAGEGRRMFRDTVPSGLSNRIAMTVREPVGVVSIITPWNLPSWWSAAKTSRTDSVAVTSTLPPSSTTPHPRCGSPRRRYRTDDHSDSRRWLRRGDIGSQGDQLRVVGCGLHPGHSPCSPCGERTRGGARLPQRPEDWLGDPPAVWRR